MDYDLMTQNTLMRRIIVAAMLVLMLILSLATIPNETPTIDETTHIYSGYTYLRNGNLSINPEHPPWVKEVAALPLLFFDIDYNRPEAQGALQQVDSSVVFFYGMGNNPDLMLTSSRIMMIILMLLGALILYLFSRKLFGTWVGLLALFMAAISPVFLAYGRLVTPDFPCAATMLLTLYLYWQFLHKRKWTWLALSGISLGFALMTQDTALSLILILPVLGIIQSFLQRRAGKKADLKRQLLGLLAIVIVAVLVIGVYYGIHTSHMDDEDIAQTIETRLPHDSLGYSFAKGLNRISPPLAMYSTSVLRNYYFNRQENAFIIYLNDTAQTGPFWYYYPEAFFLKTPLGILALLALALLFFPWRNMRLNEYFIVIPIVILMIIAAFIRVQFGVKYLIPLYAFLYIFIARGVVRMITIIKRAGRRVFAIGAVILLLVFSTVSVLSVMPNIIPYFNLSIGSRDNGYHYLAEHNVDWGQDIKALADFVEENDITYLQTGLYEIGNFTSPEMEFRLAAYYMPQCQIRPFDGSLSEGWFALSTSFRAELIYLYPELATYLDTLEPYAIINHSILIYNIDF